MSLRLKGLIAVVLCDLKWLFTYPLEYSVIKCICIKLCASPPLR